MVESARLVVLEDAAAGASSSIEAATGAAAAEGPNKPMAAKVIGVDSAGTQPKVLIAPKD